LTQRHVRHSHSPAGFGLGLSIVKTIMDRHQGALLLQSPPPGLAQGFEARLRFKV
jgi:two-component system OmpR family sensor kinase